MPPRELPTSATFFAPVVSSTRVTNAASAAVCSSGVDRLSSTAVSVLEADGFGRSTANRRDDG